MEVKALLELLKKAWPYLLAAGIGFGAAWWIQGVKVGHVENEKTKVENAFQAYQTEQARLKNEAEERERLRREKSEKEFNDEKTKLEADIAAGNAFKRCVAAGKCGGLRNAVPNCSGLRLPPIGGTDEGGANAIPVAGESAAPPVIADCALTTLMLNKLQADIENQGGYAQ